MFPTKENLKKLTDGLVQAYPGLTFRFYKDGCHSCIFDHSSNIEILRLDLDKIITSGDEEVFGLGLSFHVSILNTDAIQIFSRARIIEPLVQLRDAYYYGSDNKYYRGSQAFMKCENDKEGKVRNLTIEELRMQQLEEWEMSRLEREGKLKIQ